ncbi:cobalamin-dependent protein [Aquibacillus sediminis]|uniref:cobalamin-dependent protein n=1 Tax=Aquibacillus sediminis TaxID=2574734 RepID=UPI001109E216|nr:cobalamin-dependent protein [Aquibacillus sediminis]
MTKSVRVLIAKVGLDGHDRGALILARALQERGLTVFYTGIRNTPAQVVERAISEEVDVVALSSLSGAHLQLFPKVVRELNRKTKRSIPVVAGGLIPLEHWDYLYQQGIVKIFAREQSIEAFVDYIYTIK